ncbi:MAG: hypothetical protein ABIZ72_01020 [Candidatus Limnocylindrales bacterium]
MNDEVIHTIRELFTVSVDIRDTTWRTGRGRRKGVAVGADDLPPSRRPKINTAIDVDRPL